MPDHDAAMTLATTYEPHAFEERWYAHWEEEGFFKPSGDRSKPAYCIVIPPPNVTGELHMGHALTFTVEDILIRWHRMLGDDTLWIPGTDHAGIATQFLVERQLAAQGLTRHDLGRERLVDMLWDWKQTYHDAIVRSLRRLGTSCDWSRERFTLDEGLSRAVRTVFVRLYEQGLIYRGAYMINWCPRCMSALSDLEIDYEEEQSSLWYVRYLVRDDHTQGIVVATTRPETMLGDTGVAVHPDDPRYQPLIGKYLVLPIVGREIPIVADDVVDRDFGTGAVKVTPAHDPVDNEIGARQRLTSVQVIGPDGLMTSEAGELAGLDRFVARSLVVERLQASGALVKIEPHTHAVAHCERCRTVLEPLVSQQWFVRMQSLAEPAIAAAEDGRIRFVPERFTGVYLHWMRNIHDWCISRQIWWGHRIPVWTCEGCGKVIVTVETPTKCPDCNSGELRQEDDVLDTWFSSGLWPFSTLGWPDRTEELARYYPTSVLETGYDILFHWVSRMIMLGLEFMGDVPFGDVYLHGMVHDEHGMKMSKTKGNVVDPLVLVERYGTDSLRWSLTTGTTPGNDTRISDRKLEDSRNFMNKLWNAVRFVLGRDVDESVGPAQPGLPERWVKSRLNATIDEATSYLYDYQLGEAGRAIKDFVWGDLCDWYIEVAKVRGREDAATLRLTQETLFDAISASLRLLHPFVPFVTEHLWQALPSRVTAKPNPNREGQKARTIMLSSWPARAPRDLQAENEMGTVFDVVRAIRTVRAEKRTPQNRLIPASVALSEEAQWVDSTSKIVETLAKTEKLGLLRHQETPPANAYTIALHSATVYLPVAGMLDLDEERTRLDAESTRAALQVERIEKLLARPGFIERAPSHVVEAERVRLQESLDLLARLREQRDRLSAM